MQILKSEVEDFQKSWAKAVLAIGEAFVEGEDFRSMAMDFVEDFYAFDEEKVLLKPGFANKQPFRNDKLSALAYFIGGNPNFREDAGFAIQSWDSIKFRNEDFLFKENMTVSSGVVSYVSKKGDSFHFNLTLGLTAVKDGAIKVILHHASKTVS